MSRTHFRVNPNSIVAWMSRKSLQRREVRSLSVCIGTRTHNHLVRKRTLNHWTTLASLVFVYEIISCGLESCRSHFNLHQFFFHGPLHFFQNFVSHYDLTTINKKKYSLYKVLFFFNFAKINKVMRNLTIKSPLSLQKQSIICDFNTRLYSNERHWMAFSEFSLSKILVILSTLWVNIRLKLEKSLWYWGQPKRKHYAYIKKCVCLKYIFQFAFNF